MSTIRQLVWVIAIAALGMSIGCASNSPTAPGSVATTSSGSSASSGGGTLQGAASGNQLEIEGLITAIDAVGKTITVANTIIAVQGTTLIRHGDSPLQFGDLHVGDLVEVNAMRAGTVLTALTVNDETEHPSATPPAPNDDPPGHDATEDNHTSDDQGHDAGGDDDHDGGTSTSTTTGTGGDSHHSDGDSGHGGHGRD